MASQNFKSKEERDAWIRHASDADVIQYFKEHKPALLVKARRSMRDDEIANWCRFMADYTNTDQDIEFHSADSRQR